MPDKNYSGLAVYEIDGQFYLGEDTPKRLTLWQRIKKHGWKARIF